MNPNQLLTKPDGNILAMLTDNRVWSTAIGAVVGNIAEKQIITTFRDTYGIAVPVGIGGVKYTNTAGAENTQFGTNRQLLRAGLVLGAVAGIEYIPDKSGIIQYMLFGVAVVSMAHLFQGLVPSLR